MSDESAPRALNPLRHFIFAAFLVLGWTILGTQSARADSSTPVQPVLSRQTSSTSLKPTHVRIPAPIRLVVDPGRTTSPTATAKAGANAAAKATANAGANGAAKATANAGAKATANAGAKPGAAVFKSVTSGGDHASSRLPVVKQVVAPQPALGPVTNLVTGLVPKGVATATFTSAVVLNIVMALPSSVDVIGRRHSSVSLALADMGSMMNEPAAGLTFEKPVPQTVVDSSWYRLISAGDPPSFAASGASAPTSPGTPKMPVNTPCSLTPGPSGTGSGGHGLALADLSAGPITCAALQHGGLPLCSSVLPKSLSDDPGSRPA